MPAKSEAQRKKLYATFGAAWVKRHHYDNAGKLPARLHPKKKPKRKKPVAKKKKPKCKKCGKSPCKCK